MQPSPTEVLFALAAEADARGEPVEGTVLANRLSAGDASVRRRLDRLVELGLIARRSDGYALAVSPGEVSALAESGVDVLVVDDLAGSLDLDEPCDAPE
jgi:DNA-binding IclR family transcriptional regulator